MNDNNETELYQSENKGEIILYQPDNSLQLEVRVENETVWLTQAQIAKLFGTEVPAISKHINNIYKVGELDRTSTISILETVQREGQRIIKRQTAHYNLDMIISVGYRVNSLNATRFRIWATRTLKDYLLKGYAINQRFERIEQRLGENERKIDFFVRTSLPPKEGILYDGQIFDAHIFVSDLIKLDKTSVTVIDNYMDESVLLLLTKRNVGVSATVYTSKISPQLQLDIQRHNAQYPAVTVHTFTRSHDRFLVIDDDVYHIGASLKDLGKKWFAFSKMLTDARELLKNII
jgi:hypothetical protein